MKMKLSVMIRTRFKKCFYRSFTTKSWGFFYRSLGVCPFRCNFQQLYLLSACWNWMRSLEIAEIFVQSHAISFALLTICYSVDKFLGVTELLVYGIIFCNHLALSRSLVGKRRLSWTQNNTVYFGNLSLFYIKSFRSLSIKAKLIMYAVTVPGQL